MEENKSDGSSIEKVSFQSAEYDDDQETMKNSDDNPEDTECGTGNEEEFVTSVTRFTVNIKTLLLVYYKRKNSTKIVFRT